MEPSSPRRRQVLLLGRSSQFSVRVAVLLTFIWMYNAWKILQTDQQPQHLHHHSSSLFDDAHSDALKRAEVVGRGKGLRAPPQKYQAAIHHQKYPNSNVIPVGILSHKPPSFFKEIRQKIDQDSHAERCRRYGSRFNSTGKKKSRAIPRRIFYGALLADEPWELLEIVAAESYGIFAGMVFVESNRTQNLTPRTYGRLEEHDGPRILAQLFGLDKDDGDIVDDASDSGSGTSNTRRIQVRAHVNENLDIWELRREHVQRREILQGWKELGMQPDDIGLLADTDEMITRDFLLALQWCDGDAGFTEFFEYEKHKCKHDRVKLGMKSIVFESSPECITKDRFWHHPDVIIGACLEGIGDKAIAPRDNDLRARGFGRNCEDWEYDTNMTDGLAWNAGDFRFSCAGGQALVARTANDDDSMKMYGLHTGFHFHNFFENMNQTRQKYSTYGHANVMGDPLHAENRKKPFKDLHPDLELFFHCIKDMDDPPFSRKYKRELGGFEGMKPFRPIYFHDNDYRRRKHRYLQKMVALDEEVIATLTVNRNSTSFGR